MLSGDTVETVTQSQSPRASQSDHIWLDDTAHCSLLCAQLLSQLLTLFLATTSHLTPYTLHLTPHTLHLTPSPYILHLSSNILYSYTLQSRVSQSSNSCFSLATPLLPDLEKMFTSLEGNTEAGFLFATLREFIHLWKSGKEGTLSLKCKNGRNSVKFQSSLGHPDSPHIQDGRRKRKHRVKSDTRRARDNARAAVHQAARASLQPAASPPRTVSSPAPPPPPARLVTSLARASPAGTDNTPAAPHRSNPTIMEEDITEEDITASSPLSSPREENASQVVTDLQLWRDVQPCELPPTSTQL